MNLRDRIADLEDQALRLRGLLEISRKRERLARQVSFTTALALDEAKLTIAEKDKAIEYYKQRSRLDFSTTSPKQ